MNREPIDQILATEEDLVPTSGFLASVMERVQEEAAAPQPIPFPFPWKRAVPGIVLAAGVLGWGGFELVRLAVSEAGAFALTAPNLSASAILPLQTAGWIAGSLALSLLCWVLASRLAGRKGLL